jgi:hypothetical protein
MKNELLKEMNKRLADEYYEIADLDDKLRKEYKDAQLNKKSVKELNGIAEKINQLESTYREIKSDINLYKKVSVSGDKTVISAIEEKLMEKYDVYSIELENASERIKEDEDEEDKSEKSKTATIIAGTLAGIEALALGTIALSSCNKEVVQVSENDSVAKKDSSVTETKTEESKKTFIDASNDNQVEKQAQLIYDNYVNTSDTPEAFKSTMTVEKISDVLRMANGQFKMVDGNVSYNAEDIDLIANYINEYANSTSYKQYGTNLKFKPMAVFFEQDTDAYEIVSKGDELMSKVYEDIKAGDVEKFKEDSVNWGIFIKDTLEKTSLDGNVKSIWTLPASQQFYVAQALTSQYGCSIMEYGIALDLADSQGNTHSICIPYCYNESGSVVYKPLSELIYDINNTPMNDLAARAGHLKEWQDKNESIMWELGNNAEEYYNSKYELEVGYSKKLK